MRKARFGLFMALTILAMQLSFAAAEEFLFDFQGHPDTDPGETAIGYTAIDPTTPIYSAGQGYGFLDLTGITGIGGRNRGGTDLRLKDFMYIAGIEPVFRVDVANGEYTVDVWAGEMDYTRIVRMEVSADGGANWTLYGCDVENDTPLPDTYMTTFVDSGSDGMFLQTIPDGRQHYFANYYMFAREFLQVHAVHEVTQGHLLFRTGSSDRIFNAIDITSAPTTCAEMIEAGEQLPGDINADCRVNLLDFAAMVGVWGKCDDPDGSACQEP